MSPTGEISCGHCNWVGLGETHTHWSSVVKASIKNSEHTLTVDHSKLSKRNTLPA